MGSDAVPDLFYAIFASLKDWSEGSASWPRFLGWLIVSMIVGAVLYLMF